MNSYRLRVIVFIAFLNPVFPIGNYLYGVSARFSNPDEALGYQIAGG